MVLISDILSFWYLNLQDTGTANVEAALGEVEKPLRQTVVFRVSHGKPAAAPVGEAASLTSLHYQLQ